MNTRDILQQQIVEKALKDGGFRNALLLTPRETLGKEIGIRLPDSIEIQVLEEKEDTFYLILPAPGENATEAELTESELLQVAGGEVPQWIEEATNWICITNAC